jgi:hypothetical protein
MYLLFKFFFRIILLRATPQELPSSTFLMSATLLAYALVELLLALNKTPPLEALAMVSVDVILLASLCWILLSLRGLAPRYVQTLTALSGCGAMLALCAWPLLLWQQASGSDTTIMLVALLMWAWFFWQIIVFSHIISQALSSPMIIGSALALLYMYISFSVAQMLFYQEAL